VVCHPAAEVTEAEAVKATVTKPTPKRGLKKSFTEKLMEERAKAMMDDLSGKEDEDTDDAAKSKDAPPHIPTPLERRKSREAGAHNTSSVSGSCV